jgi:cell wall-associated NlpC family hydrolase
MVTNSTSYELAYNTSKILTTDDFDDALISFSIRNSMADDSPVFSLVLLGKDKWDQLLNANDLIRVKVTNSLTDVKAGWAEANPYIMVGMISDIHKEGEYVNGSILYRITGQAMTKALMDFNVGVIQEVATIIPSVGWLPDGTAQGLPFSGNTASGIAGELVTRFMDNYAKYQFNNGNTLKNYLSYQFTSWVDDEALVDVTPFINYQGSIRQFLEDIAAKPFNELFFDYDDEGKCIAYMRPTPFDKEKWDPLETTLLNSSDVVQESFGKSDAEMYSIYVVQAPNIMEFNSMDIGVFPKFHPALIDKYGYKRLDVQNRYLRSSGANASITGGGGTSGNDLFLAPTIYPGFNTLNTFILQNNLDTAAKTDRSGTVTAIVTQFSSITSVIANSIVDSLVDGSFDFIKYSQILFENGVDMSIPDFNNLMLFINNRGYNDKEVLRLQRGMVFAALIAQYPNMPNSLVNGILDGLKGGTLTEQTYKDLIASTGTSAPNNQTNNQNGIAGVLLEKYTERIFNWYCENVNFYSGDIRVIGSPDYRIGTKLLYTDYEQQTVWEFYIESVQHEFDFMGGYTTILGVTRGLQNSGESRFTNLYGKSQDFVGGYLGEYSLAQLWELGQNPLTTPAPTGTSAPPGGINPVPVATDPYGNPVAGSGSGSSTAMKALATGLSLTQRAAVYKFGAGRGHNPFYDNIIYADCSSFVYWCYKTNGITLNGSTTDSIKQDPRLQVVGLRGANKNQVLQNLRQGDLIWFDTYKVDGHIGIYAGNGKFVAISGPKGQQRDIMQNDITSSYYWKVFKGHARRFVDGSTFI